MSVQLFKDTFMMQKLIDKYPELRLRLVKGAYKEKDTIAYQSKKI